MNTPEESEYLTGDKTYIHQERESNAKAKKTGSSNFRSKFQELRQQKLISRDSMIGAVGISIQWHFKCHMPELTFISTVSFQTALGIGMHSL